MPLNVCTHDPVLRMSAGQIEEPQPAAAAAVCAPSHAWPDCIHSQRLRQYGQLQPSEDYVDNIDTQPCQCKQHDAGVWAVEQELIQQGCLGVLRVRIVTKSFAVVFKDVS